ncbi:TPA: helix-turn-helix domain-containing protein [Stenotrophomonas maltophilia]
MSVGIRLKEERKRLGLTQEAMGLACGVAKRTQILFEKDAHLPGGAYFVAADELGVDVTYVLVGRRERLAEADADLLDAWRNASPSARAAVMAALRGVTPAATTAAPRTSFENTSIGQQISGDVDLRGQKIVVRQPKASKKPSR